MRIDRREVERKARIASLSFFGVLFAFWIWWYFASNYNYGALAGTYVFRGEGVTSTLLLRKDATFHQTLQQKGLIHQADGRWERIGEGGVNFSPEFLRVPGAQTFIEQQPGHGDGTVADNEFYGEFEKFLGIYPSLHLDPKPDGPVFHKQLFR
jgi:hypothetical protein